MDGEHLEAAHILGGGQELTGLAQRRLGLELLQGLTGGFQLRRLLLSLGGQLTGGGLEDVGRLEQQLLVAVHGLQAQLAHGGLDPADAGGHGPLGLDAEGAGLGGVVQVGAAAKLHGEVAHLHHPDGVAVLLAEHGHSALGLGLVNGQLLGDHGIALQDGVVHQPVDLRQLLRGNGLEVGEVEAQPVRLHQGARLVHVVAQDLLQRGIQQMGGAVGPADGLAALGVDGGGDGVAHLQNALFYHAAVEELAALVLLDVLHLQEAAGAADDAVVGHLTAHLGVEGGLVQDYRGLGPGGHLVPQLALGHDGKDLAIRLAAVIAQEGGGGHLLAELDAGPAQVAQGLPGLPGTDALLLHHLVEAIPVHGHAFLLGHLHGQVHGEAVGIVELEGVGAGEHGLPRRLVGGEHLAVDLHAAVDGAGEVLLLGADDLGDIGLLLPQVGIGALVLMDHGVHHLVEEGVVDAQELAVAGGPAQQAAQHVAPALVAGQDAVADHEDGGADVVGDDPEGDILGMTLAVVGAGDLAHLIGDVHNGVHVEQRVHVLTHAGKALQAHAGVDVLLLELGVVALTVVVELGEDVVPHLDIPVAVAAHSAGGLAAAVLGAPVIVHLGAGAAGAGAVLPEVVLLAEAEDPVGGDADVLVPDLEGLVVVQVDGGIQAILLQAHHLGQKLPAEGDGLLLEVVAEGEVAQHLEVGAVAVGLADVLDIAGADALLAGADPVTGGLLLPGEPGLHGGHAGVDQQQGFVVGRGNQGEAGQAQVALALKVAEEHLPQFVQPVIGMCHTVFPPKNDEIAFGNSSATGRKGVCGCLRKGVPKSTARKGGTWTEA